MHRQGWYNGILFKTDGIQPIDREVLQNQYQTCRKINEDYKKIVIDKELTLPLITLYYGPYLCNGIIKHRPQKLFGLADSLEKTGLYSIELIPTSRLNSLEIFVMGNEIHRMNLKYLPFNIACEYNVCLWVKNKIEEAISRLYRNRNVARDISMIQSSTVLTSSKSDVTKQD